MAMTVRFSEELDSELQSLADAQHTSKHALVLRAVEEHLARETKTRRVLASIDDTSKVYAETIQRLEDA